VRPQEYDPKQAEIRHGLPITAAALATLLRGDSKENHDNVIQKQAFRKSEKLLD
jgi:hypothetical protein